MKADRITLAVATTAALLCISAAADNAGGWNDGSRLATVESLVDYGTWAIDQSVFAQSAESRRGLPSDPYGENGRESCPAGTLDKLFIDGHYYSDKSPAPALPMAGIYWVWRQAGGPSFSANAKTTIWFLTLATSGLAYLIAILAVDSLAGRRLDIDARLAVVASFALSTVALPYAQTVNNHILLLTACCCLLVLIDSRDITAARLVAMGALGGAAYAIDLGAGPVVCLGVGVWTLARTRSIQGGILVAVAGLPFVALHHWLNYRIGGSWKPANAVPEFFNWPGCPFNTSNMTGSWRHNHVGAFLVYAADLLLGRRGFLNYNLPLYLAAVGFVFLWRRTPNIRKELALCGFWCGGIWMIYAATSNNHSGECCSVRWFVPMLAPGYYLLIRYLEWQPDLRSDLMWLSATGTLLVVGMNVNGPWSGRMPWGFWPILAIAGCGWYAIARNRRNHRSPSAIPLRRAA